MNRIESMARAQVQYWITYHCHPRSRMAQVGKKRHWGTKDARIRNPACGGDDSRCFSHDLQFQPAGGDRSSWSTAVVTFNGTCWAKSSISWALPAPLARTPDMPCKAVGISTTQHSTWLSMDNSLCLLSLLDPNNYCVETQHIMHQMACDIPKQRIKMANKVVFLFYSGAPYKGLGL